MTNWEEERAARDAKKTELIALINEFDAHDELVMPISDTVGGKTNELEYIFSDIADGMANDRVGFWWFMLAMKIIEHDKYYGLHDGWDNDGDGHFDGYRSPALSQIIGRLYEYAGDWPYV